MSPATSSRTGWRRRRTIPRLGHYGNGSRIDPDAAYRRHQKNQGGVPEDIFLRKRAYAWSRPHVRPEQRYQDFYPEWQPFENEALKGKTFGDKAWFGKRGVEYVAFIGLRGDEPHRVQRVEARNDTAAGYEGEHVYMPLNDMAVTRDDVNAFWERQNWDLALPKDHESVELRVLLPEGSGEPRRHPRWTGGCPGHRGAGVRTARRHAMRSAVVDENRGAVRPRPACREAHNSDQRDSHRVLREPPVRLQESCHRTRPRRAERVAAAVRLHRMTGAPVYLDYQATTPVDPSVREAMMPFLGDLFGNPHSSDHSFGWDAARAIKDARASVAALINADDDEIVFYIRPPPNRATSPFEESRIIRATAGALGS